MFKVLLIGITLVVSSCSKQRKTHVDQLFTNATLITPDSTVSNYSIAVSEGRIVGLSHEVESRWESTDTVDLNGAYLYAGFIDAHAHFVGYAKGLQSVDLRGTKSWEEVVQRTIEFAEANPHITYITGRGWDQNDWSIDKRMPMNTKLNIAFPNTPVVLTRIDGHAVMANQAALDLDSVDFSTTVEGGEVRKNFGHLTGLLIDNATSLLKIPETSNAQLAEGLMMAQENCFAVGLTTIDDAGLSKPMIEFIDSLQQANLLKMRIYAMVSDDPRWMNYYLKNGFYQTDRLNVRSFKFYGDGALGSRGACLRQPYHDEPHYYGLMLSSEEHFRESAKKLADAGFQMNTHAIGDSANHLLLQIYWDTFNEYNEGREEEKKDFRWRIEHAQVVSERDFEKFDQPYIIPSIQPTHATSDMYWAERRLGPERVKNAYAYRELLNPAGWVALGTDFPVEEIDPLNTFYAAVVRKDHEGYPEGGFQMENALSRKDALRGMTIWAAISNFEEEDKGSIELGKWADFTILDTDLLTCPEEDILRARVLYTVINGEVVYKND
ncbi:MAG: amidohydrolase [Flavobacteriia bacterium]|nr:amidohydrolase [Flavobacteriia bacterium]